MVVIPDALPARRGAPDDPVPARRTPIDPNGIGSYLLSSDHDKDFGPDRGRRGQAMTDVLDTVTLTERAARRIARIVAGQDGATALRVAVEGGGCSGFSYRFDLAPGPEADDLVIERDGAVVVIDQTSLPFMSGSEIDFVDDLIGQ